jgi:hypothetical protein
MKALFVNIVTSEQYGNSKDLFIGVFDDDSKIEAEIINAKNKYASDRPIVKIIEIVINKVLV